MSTRSKVFIKMLLEELFTKGEHTNYKLYQYLNIDVMVDYECENDKSLGSNIDDMLNSFVKNKRSKKKILARYMDFDDDLLDDHGDFYKEACVFCYIKDFFNDILVAYDFLKNHFNDNDYKFMDTILNISIINAILGILGLDNDNEKENRLSDAIKKLEEEYE